MMNVLERKPKVEPVQKMYLIVITPPDGPAMVGIRPAVSEGSAYNEVMGRLGKTKSELSGRVSVTLLRPKKGMEYRETEFTVTRKSNAEFLDGLLVSVN